MKVLCIVDDGFEDIEAITTIDFLRRETVEIDIVSIDGKDKTSAHAKAILSVKKAIDKIDEAMYGALFIPGGQHYKKLEANEEVKKIIQSFYNSKRLIGMLCAAPTILGRMGLLQNKRYTCFTSMNENFGGTYVDQYVVIDENLITARSASASIAFALAFLEEVAGKDSAENLRTSIYY